MTALTFAVAFGLMRSADTLAGNQASPISILISTVALCIALPLAAVALRKSSHAYSRQQELNDSVDEDDADEVVQQQEEHATNNANHLTSNNNTHEATRKQQQQLLRPPPVFEGAPLAMFEPTVVLTPALARGTSTVTFSKEVLQAEEAKEQLQEEAKQQQLQQNRLAATFASPDFASPLFSDSPTVASVTTATPADQPLHALSPAPSPAPEGAAASTEKGGTELLKVTTTGGDSLAAAGGSPPLPTVVVTAPLSSAAIHKLDVINATNALGGGSGAVVVPRFKNTNALTEVGSARLSSAASESMFLGRDPSTYTFGPEISMDEGQLAPMASQAAAVSSSLALSASSKKVKVPKPEPPIAHIKVSSMLFSPSEGDGEVGAISTNSEDRRAAAAAIENNLRQAVLARGDGGPNIDPHRRKLLAKRLSKARPPLLALEYAAFAVFAMFPLLLLFLTYYAFNGYAVGVASALSAEWVGLGLITLFTLLVIWRRTKYYALAADTARTYVLFSIPSIVVGSGFALPFILPSFGTYALAATIILLTFFPGRWRMFVGNAHMVLLAFVVYVHGKNSLMFLLNRGLNASWNPSSSSLAATTANATTMTNTSSAATGILPGNDFSSPFQDQTPAAHLMIDAQHLFVYFSSHFAWDMVLIDLCDILASLGAFLVDALPIVACMWYGQYLRGRPETDGSHYRPAGLRLCYSELFSCAERFFDVRVLADDLEKTRNAQKVHYHYHHHHHRNKTTNEVTTTTTVNTTGGAIIGFHPHGVFPVTLLWVHFTRRWERMFSGCPRIVAHGASIIFQTPMLRDVAMTVGTRAVTRTAIESVIKDGLTPLIVPGGQAEMIHSAVSDTEMHIVTYHVGFIRLAMQHKRAVIPLVSFGEQDILSNVHAPRMQAFFVRKIGFGFPVLPMGQWNLPVPLRAKLRIAIGKPIYPAAGEDDHSNPQHVAKVAKAYFDELREIFYKYREEAGYPKMELYYHHEKKDPLKSEKQLSGNDGMVDEPGVAADTHDVEKQ